MRKYLLTVACFLLLGGIAAHADSLYAFNGTVSTNSGAKSVTGTFTWNGSTITSWNLDFSQLAGTCGYYCQFAMAPFSTIGNGYILAGHSSDTNDTASGDDSYASYQSGQTNTILSIAGMQNDSAVYSTQTGFNFNPNWTFNLSGPNVYAEVTLSNGNQDDFEWTGGGATLLSPEPPSAVLMLTGGLLLMAGFTWYERRRNQAVNN